MSRTEAPPRTRRACIAGALLAALLIAPLTKSPARQQSGENLPPDLAAFIQRASAVLKSGDAKGLQELGASPAALAWTSRPAQGLRGDASWRLAAIPLPGRAQVGGYLAVFSSFHTCESIGDHVHPLVRTPDGWRLGPEILETDTRGYRVRDNRLAVRFDLPAASCTVVDDVRVERTSTSAGVCLLRLSSDMRVDRVTYQGSSFPVRATPGLIAFAPPDEKAFTLRIEYHGTVSHRFSDFIRPSEVVLISYWYPHIARLPAKSTVIATVPKDWTAVSAGELVSRDEGARGVTFTYRNEVPICYLTLDAGPYVTTTRQVGGRTLSVYQLRADGAVARRSLDTLASALPFFEKRFGTFPYSRYGVVVSAGPIGGAMEAYSFATFDPGTAPGAVAHELSHTWWGGIVPNPYTTDMWNEWFASYSDDLYGRLTRGDTGPALRGMHSRDSGSSGQWGMRLVPLATAFDTSNPADSAAGYGKGSHVLAMLEDLLGTDTMIRSMRRFREDHVSGEAADWPDFQRAVNKVTGQDWAWFFDQWVRRAENPRVRLADVQVAHEGGGYTLTGRVVQQGDPYRLTIPVAMEVVNGAPVKQRVQVTGASTEFRLAAPSEPRALRLDPQGTILMAGFGSGDPFRWKAAAE